MWLFRELSVRLGKYKYENIGELRMAIDLFNMFADIGRLHIITVVLILFKRIYSNTCLLFVCIVLFSVSMMEYLLKLRN